MISHGVKQWLNKDPYWNNVVLYMDMEGANNGTTFIDHANTPHVFTISGSGVTTKTDNKKWGISSAYTNKGGQLQANALAGDVLNGDFTIECWVYLLDRTYGAPGPGWIGWGGYTSGICFTIDYSTGIFQGYINNVVYLYSDTAIPLNTWSHLAMTRQGTSIRGFLNGIKKDILNTTESITPSGLNIRIMGWTGTTSGSTPNSYLDAVRVTKGVARYTESFDHTALTEFSYSNTSNDPYWKNVVLFMNMEGSNGGTTFNDLANPPHTFAISGTALTTSTTQKKWGFSSAYTNNTGKLIATALSTDVLDGDFTIECWVFPINRTLGGSVRGPGWLAWGAYNTGITFLMSETSGLFEGYIGGPVYSYSTTAIPLNTWSHLALVRTGTSIRGFLNGVGKDVVTNSSTFTPSGANIRVMGWVGTDVDGVPEGFLDAVRVTKGVARYTADFDHTALIEFPGP